MKKARKSPPKAIKHRAPMPAGKRSRVPPLHPAPTRIEDIVRATLRRAERGLAEVMTSARRVTSDDLAPRLRRLTAEARSLALPYSHDERQALALLFLPFLLVAYAIVVHQSVRTFHGTIPIIAMPDDAALPVRPAADRAISLAAVPQSIARETAPTRTVLASVRFGQEIPSIASLGLAPIAVPLGTPMKSVAAPDIGLANDRDRIPLTPSADTAVAQAHTETKLALLAPPEFLARDVDPVPPRPIQAFELDEQGKPLRPGICAIDQAPRPVAMTEELRTLDADAFGMRLAQAAQFQTDAFVIYNEAYRTISYPMGDVPSLFGVCTDVVVRAYRTLGLDLQALVKQSRSGRGDASIDHRRTETLRRFFAKEGEILPITSFPEDYRPGDIVTYYRPQNRGARAHIAIVSSVVAPSGRPMIVHNRGWGPQLEDALFVDQITGHYRYRGPAATRNAHLPDRIESAAGAIASAPPALPVSDGAQPQVQR